MPKSTDKIPAKNKKVTKLKATTGKKNQLLGVIAQVAALHKDGKAPRDLVAKRAGYGSETNPSFKKALSRASKRGHVDLSDKKAAGLALTAEGVKAAGDVELPDPVKSNEDAQEKIKDDLSPAMKKVFDILLVDGKPHKRSDIAAMLGYENEKAQGFKKLVDRIRLKGYLECVGKDQIQLSDLCFPAGRDTTVDC